MKDAVDRIAKKHADVSTQIVTRDIRVADYFQLNENGKKRSTKPTSSDETSNCKQFGDTVIKGTNGLRKFIDFIVKVTVPDCEKLPWEEAQESKRSEYSSYILNDKFCAFAADYNCCFGLEAKKLLGELLPKGRVGRMERAFAFESITIAIARGNSRMIDSYVQDVRKKNYNNSMKVISKKGVGSPQKTH